MMTAAIPTPSKTTRPVGEPMAREDGREHEHEDRLRELAEEMEGIKEELERTWQVLHLGRGDASDSATRCETIVAALGALRQTEAARIIELTDETHRIADKMSYAIRMRATERVLFLAQGDAAHPNVMSPRPRLVGPRSGAAAVGRGCRRPAGRLSATEGCHWRRQCQGGDCCRSVP